MNKEELIQILMKDGICFIQRAARRYEVPGYTRKDLVQEGVVEVLKSLHTFNPQKSKFTTWITNVVRCRFYRLAICGDLIRIPQWVGVQILKKKYGKSYKQNPLIEEAERINRVSMKQVGLI